jgi:hypothetical protein
MDFVAKATPKPKTPVPANARSSAASDAAKIAKSESMLRQQLKAGKVTDIAKTKAAIAKKTGVWPNGSTN